MLHFQVLGPGMTANAIALAMQQGQALSSAADGDEKLGKQTRLNFFLSCALRCVHYDKSVIFLKIP